MLFIKTAVSVKDKILELKKFTGKHEKNIVISITK